MALTEHGFNWKTSPSGLIIPAQADNPSLGPGVVDVEFEHKTSGVAAGTYGDGSHYPAVTVDAYGHVTGVTLEASGGGGSGSLLFSSTLAAAAASIDTGAGGIAAGYNVLLVYAIIQSTKAAVTDSCQITINGDTAAHYYLQYLASHSATVTAGIAAAANNWQFEVHASQGTSAFPTVITMVIPAYAATTFGKIGRATSSTLDATAADNQALGVAIGSTQTAAISQMTFTCSGSSLAAGSSVYVYGL